MSASTSPLINTRAEGVSSPPTHPEALQSSLSNRDETDSASTESTSTATKLLHINRMPAQARRSMEDELRPVPSGWVREFDSDTQSRFSVDTNYDPCPRSIWHHPHDDTEFLSSLNEDEKENLLIYISETASREEKNGSDELTNFSSDSKASGSSEKRSLASKLKDALTGTTDDQRVSAKAEKVLREKKMYRQHHILHRGFTTAMHICRSAFLGKDENRTHMFREAPGHTFPGVAGAKPLSPHLCEIVYDGSEHDYSKPKGRCLRPESKMYVFGYGGNGCGKFAGERWSKPAGEYEGRGPKKSWSIAMPVLTGMTMAGFAGLC